MPRFRFRLETVLRYRRRVEEWKESAFAMARMKRLAAESRRHELETECKQIGRKDLGSDIERHVQREVYLQRLADLIAEQQQLIGILLADETKRKDEWLAARRDRRVLEELRSRALSRHEAEMLREEQKELDEWSILCRSARGGDRMGSMVRSTSTERMGAFASAADDVTSERDKPSEYRQAAEEGSKIAERDRGGSP